MFKGQSKSPTKSPTKSPAKYSKATANELSLLISRMQKNADQVEKNIIETHQKLKQDVGNYALNKTFQHQKENAQNLKESELLLKDLFLDVDKAKKYGHPQAIEIEQDIRQLHERLSQECTEYRDVYEKMNLTPPGPKVNWPQILDSKKKEIKDGVYGPSLRDVEHQIAAHNILQREIDEYGTEIRNLPEENASIKNQYRELQEDSTWRGRHLGSLYNHLNGCTKELAYLSDEQNKILKQDWSDQIPDVVGTRRQYERFKSEDLLPQEEKVNDLLDDGDRLVELKHPASNSIQAHNDALKGEWQNFLNLCICQETHLKNAEDYKKFQEGADSVSQTFKNFNQNLDSKYSQTKSVSPGALSELQLQLEKDEKQLIQAEKNLADLTQRSSDIVPIKQRRMKAREPVTVDTICDWDSGDVQLNKGETYTLKDNSKRESWVVQNSKGEAKGAPATCFVIPPPDLESIERVKRLEGELSDLKKKKVSVQNALKSSSRESTKPIQLAPVGTPPVPPARTSSVPSEDPKGAQILNKLDKIYADLQDTEKEVLARVRSPVSRSSPSQDLTGRLKEQEGTARHLDGIASEKDAAQRECESFLAKMPSGPVASQLPSSLTKTNNKYNEVKALTSLYGEEAKASLNLENQIKKTDDMISGFEGWLAKDGLVPYTPNALQERVSEIQKMRKELVDKQDNLLKLNRSLKDTELACNALQSNTQEHSPDLPRQRVQVQRQNDRYHAIADQLDQREKMLRDANLPYQQFKSTSEGLDLWLNNLPRNQVTSSDGPSQVNYKLQSQKRLVDEIQRKEPEKNNMVKLSHDLVNTLGEYEAVADRYRSTLETSIGATDPKMPRVSTLQEGIENKEKDLVKRYTEAAVESKQQLSQMDFAKRVLDKSDTQDGVQLAVQNNLRSENVRRSIQEAESLSRNLEDEKRKVAEVQQALEENRKRLLLLKTQRPVERLEEKEVVQYYREPRLESELATLRSQVENAHKEREKTQSEIEVVSKKLVTLESQRKTIKPQLLTKEVTEIERDPNLESQAQSLRKEIKELKEENNSISVELEYLRKEVLALEQKQPNIKEKVVLKEVVKLERDPDMVKATRALQMQIDDDTFRRKSLKDNILKLRSKTEDLEKMIATVEPKVIVKEVKKVEQDPEILKEAARLRTLIEEERNKTLTVTRELTELQSKYVVVEKQKPKIEIKERVNEIFVVEPETEKEISRLKSSLKEISSQSSTQVKQLDTIHNELSVLRSQRPVVEYKEIVQEVVKLEKTPEVMKEIERLRGQVKDLESTSSRYLEQKSKLSKERDEWKMERSKVETKTVNKEVVKYENDPVLLKEAERLRQEVREESQKRRAVEDTVYDLQNKYMLLERRKPEERVVVQEVVNLQKDPKIAEDHYRLSRTLDEEVSNRRRLERDVQQLRNLVEENEKLLNFQEERDKKLAAEKELRQITLRIKEIEESPPPVQEKIVMEEVVKVEKDPMLEKSANTLRIDLDKERSNILNIERECKNLQVKVDILQREKSIEKTIYKEVIRVEKDKVLQNERARLRELYNKERNARHNKEDETRRLKERLERVDATKRTWSKEEAELQKARAKAQKEKSEIESKLLELKRQQQQKSVFLSKESELLTQKAENERQKKMQMGHELSLLESKILKEKDSIYEKERTIRELQSRVNREERNQETQMRETNVSTKISILDPDTGKEMSPYEAYRRGIIDRDQYIQLQELECDWEEISTMGSSGEISVLLDKKSGKQYSIEDALRTRKITKEELQMYRDGRLPISEFALLVAGENKPHSMSIGSIIGNRSPVVSPTSHTQTRTFFTQSAPPKVFHDDSFPISGVYDTTVDSKCTIRSALARKMIDPVTGQKLLEAQAATGGIIDILSKDRFSVHKAIDRGMIDGSNTSSLLQAQKAFTGIEDPVTKKRLSVGEAVQKGLMSMETALPYLVVQHLTGGLIDTKKTGRIPLSEAVQQGMVSKDIAAQIQDETNYEKNLVDPITKEKVNYKEAMARCRRDPGSGLLLFQAASEAYQPTLYRPVNTIPSLTSYKY
ncbi:envoplakin [Spea bombifrons]|uniref:envoplakin n=1 Tax=Spea bombifrons TaxID=233779 RepID=UPI002349C363|nr:envoplakin [Spea bombifrons]